METAVPATPEDFAAVSYLLALATQSTRVRVQRLWRVDHAEQQRRFERCAADKLVVPSLMALDKLSPGEVAGILQRGFKKSGVQDLLWTVGNDDEVLDAAAGRRAIVEVLVCRLCVGRAKCVADAEDAHASELGAEYDSWLLRDSKSEGADGEAGEAAADDPQRPAALLPPHKFAHRYIVRDAAQILPEFVARCEVLPEASELLLLARCDLCAESAGTIYCEADDAVLCAACDVKLHEDAGEGASGELMRRHLRRPCNEVARYPGLCQTCLSADAAYWCHACKMALCGESRGGCDHPSHSAPPHGHAQCPVHGDSGCVAEHRGDSHAAVPIQEAYREALRQTAGAERQLALRAERASAVQAQLAQMDQELRQAAASGTAAQEKVGAVVENALEQVRAGGEAGALALKRDELEASRMVQEDRWLDGFLTKCAGDQTPADFLRSYIRQRRLRSALHSSNQGCLTRGEKVRRMELVGGLTVSIN